MDQKKILLAVAAIAWSGFVVAAYFVVQRPLALQVIDHLISLAWTLLLTSLLLLNALALGTLTIKQFITDTADPPAQLALAGGIGLGELGLLGFVFAAMGASKPWILLAIQVFLLGGLAWNGTLRSVFLFIKSSGIEIRASGTLVPSWMKWAVLLAFCLSFSMTFLPPADAFDALLYHLTVPERWLRDGGLVAYNFLHYWYPGLVEGAYVWGLGLGSEIVPQQIHFAWTFFTAILVWDWTQRIWDSLTAWWALVLLISIPSLLTLASWAYTDMALVFFGMAMLYTLSYGRERADTRWWKLSAISAGLAMGVKYTSFVMPLAAVVLISIWKFRKSGELFAEVLKFFIISAGVALIWYLRNWIWMGNPFYPFLFGGRYWDPFRSAWYAGSGTGSGWDVRSLILLPLTITLGYRDANSIDSDIGPLLLLAFPFALRALAQFKRVEAAHKITLTTIGFFTVFSAGFWVYGYATTRNLWQTRLLLPALVPFVIPTAVGLASAVNLDTKRLRLYFIISSIAAVSIYVNLLDVGLHVIARNPLGITAGIVTKQNYLERYQPGYADALQLVTQTPVNASIYSLFEPRTYRMDRRIQPDPILDNFSYDVHLYGDPGKIVNSWRQQGYTHVLLNTGFAKPIVESTGEEGILKETLDLLKPVSVSKDGDYELLEIPAGSLE